LGAGRGKLARTPDIGAEALLRKTAAKAGDMLQELPDSAAVVAVDSR